MIHKAMEKSQNFRIDALLAEEPSRPVGSASPESSAGSPGSPSSCAPAAFVPKPGLLHLPQAALGALPALYPPPLYPLPALAGQHPAFAYAAGFPHLAQPGPEHLKAVAGSLQLEHWIRTGIMAPRFPDFHGFQPCGCRAADHRCALAQDGDLHLSPPTPPVMFPCKGVSHCIRLQCGCFGSPPEAGINTALTPTHPTLAYLASAGTA